MDAKLRRAALCQGDSVTPSGGRVGSRRGAGAVVAYNATAPIGIPSGLRMLRGMTRAHRLVRTNMPPARSSLSSPGRSPTRLGSNHPLMEESVYTWLAITGCCNLVVTEIDLARLGGMTLFPEQQACEIDSLLEDSHQIPAVHEQY